MGKWGVTLGFPFFLIFSEFFGGQKPSPVGGREFFSPFWEFPPKSGGSLWGRGFFLEKVEIFSYHAWDFRVKKGFNYSMHKEKVRVGNYNWNKLKFFSFFKGRQPK